MFGPKFVCAFSVSVCVCVCGASYPDGARSFSGCTENFGARVCSRVRIVVINLAGEPILH